MRHLGRAVLLAAVASATAVSMAAPGSAGREAGPSTFTTRWPVLRLAADGDRVAVATGKNADACGWVGAQSGEVVLWSASSGRSTRFKPGACADEIALAGTRVAWLIHYCGNSCQLLVVLPTRSGFEREIDEADNGEGASSDPTGQFLANLHGAGSLLVYGRWDVVCTHHDPDYDEICDAWDSRGRRTVRIAGARPVIVRRGGEAAAVRAVGGGRIALQGGDGVFVRDARGKLVSAVADPPDDPPRAVELSRTHLVVERAQAIDLYGAASGKRLRSVPLRAAARVRLAGVGSGLALLRGPRRLVVVRLSDGRRRSLPLASAGAAIVDARMTAAGVFYAFDAGGHGRVVFEPAARLLALF